MHIYGNSIGSEGFNALVEGLKENYTMKELYINIKDDSIGSRETSLIRELLHRNNCLSDEVDSPISFTQEEEQMIMERRKKLDLPTQQDHDAACKAAFLLISYLQHRRKLCLIDSNEPNNASPSDSLLKPLFLMDPTDLPNVRAQEECFLSETHSYRCGICSFVCLYPCCSDNCSHIFCKVCITRRLDENKSCPLCETPCESWRQVPVIDSMIRHLIVDCPLKCGWQGLLSVYDNCHQMECIHQKGRCNLCGLEMELGQFTNIHLVESDCRIPCRYCNQVIGAPLMEVHEHYECLLAPFQCSLCQKILTWKDSLNHSNTCCGSIPAFMVHVEGDLVSDTCV
ncbi:Protein NLRC3 [Galdieria sulphuraria]|nr:Protein NLRC3 [Galdieria sulphuraria]